MRRACSWLMFATVGAGLLLDLPKRPQLVLGAFAVIGGVIAALCHVLLAAHPPAPLVYRRNPSPPELALPFGPTEERYWNLERHEVRFREELLRETFPHLQIREAAALAGILHDHSIEIYPCLNALPERLFAFTLPAACAWSERSMRLIRNDSRRSTEKRGSNSALSLPRTSCAGSGAIRWWPA